MLIAENPASGPSRVARYDPVSGRSLGSFGSYTIEGAAKDVAVTSAGKATVLGSGSTSRFDYSTGEFDGGNDVSTFYSSLNGIAGSTDFLVGGNGASNVSPGRRDTSAGTTIATYTGNFLTSAGFVPSTNPNLAVYGYGDWVAAPAIGVYNSTGGPMVSSFSLTAAQAPVGFANAFRDFAEFGGRVYGLYGDTVNDLRLLQFSFTGNTITGAAVLSPTIGTINSRVSIAAGHNGLPSILNDNVLHCYHAPSLSYYGDQTLPYAAGTLGGMDLMIAHEPGTLVAIGVGLAALIRRRRYR